MAKKSIIKKIDGVPIKDIEKTARADAREMSRYAAQQDAIIQGEIMNAPLTEEERHEHRLRTRRILEGVQNIAQKSLEIWEDLQWVNDHRTYREEYDTFNDYCKHALGKDNSTIYRSLKDAKFKEQLLLAAGDDTESASIMALKEGNTRFIRTLPEDVQVALWKLAYGIGIQRLPKKEDGSIEMTTSFLESIGEKVDELVAQGGLHVNGEFIPVTKIQEAAENVGMEETQAKALLLSVGVAEEYLEALQRQEQRIKEKSMKADFTQLKGTIGYKIDVNGSDYPILIDAKDNEYDLCELLLSYNNRFVIFSLRSPIRE